MDYNYAIEYFDPESSGSQWTTVQGDYIGQAVKEFKQHNPLARVYAVFVEHMDSGDYHEEEAEEPTFIIHKGEAYGI